jgi:hypothetical protein
MPFRGARRLAAVALRADKPDTQNGSVVPAVASAVISPGQILRPVSFVANANAAPVGRPGGRVPAVLRDRTGRLFRITGFWIRRQVGLIGYIVGAADEA